MRPIAFLAALTLISVLVPTAAPAFVVPEDGPVPFRRDRVPVDVPTMISLSAQLAELAAATAAKGGDGAESSRACAQMLALALALDPANRRARDHLRALEAGETLSAPDESRIAETKARIVSLLDWLRHPEAGDAGRALADCLVDVVRHVDPGHPAVAGQEAAGERGAWDGWVASLEELREARPDPRKADDEASVEMAEAEDEPEQNMPEPTAELVLRSAEIALPLWLHDGDSGEWRLEDVGLSLRAWIDERENESESEDEEEGDYEPFAIRLPGTGAGGREKKTGEWLRPLLEKRHGRLPEGLRLEFALPEGVEYRADRNGGSLGGAAAVLADAAFSGSPPAGRVLAAVGKDGALTPPDRIWSTLRALSLRETPGGRLVLPTTCEPLLPPQLTLDRAELFIDNDLWLASDFAGLVELSASRPPESFTRAEAAVESIRQARGTRSLGGFLTGPAIRQQLAAIHAETPAFVSAKMLELRGTPDWPSRLGRKFYAMEIRSALDPMTELLDEGWSGLRPDLIARVESRCRENLATVERLYDSVAGRSELHDPAFQAVRQLKGLASDVRRASAYWEVADRVSQLQREHRRLLETLTEAAGDAETYPLPEAR